MAKKMGTKWFLLFLLLLGTGKGLWAQQDAQFSQYIFNNIYINPAYAGHRGETNVHAFFRSQWTGVDGAPQTASLAVDGSLKDGKVGLALQLSGDRLGAQNYRSAYGNYAYRVQVGQASQLAFGLGLGFVQMGIDGDKLDPLDPMDQYVAEGMQSVLAFDARAGLFFSNEYFFAGFSVDNLIAQHTDGHKDRSFLIPTPTPHFYLTAGALFPLSNNVAIKPSFLLKDDRSGPSSLDLNAFILLNQKIWLGVSYRTGVVLYDKDYLKYNPQKTNAIVGLFEIFIADRFRIGYAFDYSINALQSYNYGTHELSLGYYFGKGRSTDRCYVF